MALMVLLRTPWGDVVSDEPLIAPEDFSALQRIGSLEAQAHAELAREAELARREGYEAGLRQAQHEAAQHLAASSADLDAQARALERHVVRAIDAGLLSVFGELPRDIALPAMIGRALAAVDLPGRLTLRVNPGDLAFAELALGRPDIDRAQLRVITDGALAPGACRIESELGSVDAGLDVQLQALREAILDGARAACAPAVSNVPTE